MLREKGTDRRNGMMRGRKIVGDKMYSRFNVSAFFFFFQAYSDDEDRFLTGGEKEENKKWIR